MERKSNAAGMILPATRQGVVARILWASGFAALTAVGAQIEIPNQPVPYTLQTLFVLLAGAILGGRLGALSQIIYLMLGIAGIPVFSGLGFGIARIIGPTGGYLLSFPIAAFFVGSLIRKHESYLWSLASLVAGLLVIFALGTIHLNLVYYHDWSNAIANGFMIFSWWDIVKLLAAAAIYREVARFDIH